MRSLTISAILIVILVVSGCKTIVETSVNLSDILNSKTKNIEGDLYVEVAACNHYEDSRKPSSSVVKTKQIMPSIFKNANYIECFSKEFKSFAHFNIPIVLDKDKDGKMASEDYLNIVSNETTLLSVAIPRSIKNNMEEVKKSNFGMSSLNLEVNIKVKNDTGKDFLFKVMSAYIENKPYLYSELSSNKDAVFTVRLSDVSVDNALQNGFSNVLMH